MKSKEKTADISLLESLLEENKTLREQTEFLALEIELLKERQAAYAKIIEEQKQRLKDLYERLARRF